MLCVYFCEPARGAAAGARCPRCRMPQRRKAPGAGDPPGCRQVQDTSPETADPPAPGKHPLTNVFKNRASRTIFCCR